MPPVTPSSKRRFKTLSIKTFYPSPRLACPWPTGRLPRAARTTAGAGSGGAFRRGAYRALPRNRHARQERAGPGPRAACPLRPRFAPAFRHARRARRGARGGGGQVRADRRGDGAGETRARRGDEVARQPYLARGSARLPAIADAGPRARELLLRLPRCAEPRDRGRGAVSRNAHPDERLSAGSREARAQAQRG